MVLFNRLFKVIFYGVLGYGLKVKSSDGSVRFSVVLKEGFYLVLKSTVFILTTLFSFQVSRASEVSSHYDKIEDFLLDYKS